MNIKYSSHFYKLGVKKSNDNLGYFTPLIEKIVSVDEIDAVKQNFLNKSETILRIDSKVKYYNKYLILLNLIVKSNSQKERK